MVAKRQPKPLHDLILCIHTARTLLASTPSRRDAADLIDSKYLNPTPVSLSVATTARPVGKRGTDMDEAVEWWSGSGALALLILSLSLKPPLSLPPPLVPPSIVITTADRPVGK
jgi:hypothetical protein